MPPDGPRESFRPTVCVDPPRAPEPGFTQANTSGLTDAELASLNEALRRLIATGLSERDAKRTLDAAVREGMEPGEAATAEMERLMSWR